MRGRPKKQRIIRQDPRVSQFSPRGKAGRPDEIELNMDEFEALRLADYKALSQQEAAQSMRISQQTFSRTLKKARRKAADGLVNGKTIRILPSHHTKHIQVERDETGPKNPEKETGNNQYMRSLGNLARYPGK
jgi:predicted DNA-binding protein (UPF0251 family)